MTVEQFDTIVRLLPQVERELKGRGLELRRPRYDEGVGKDVKDEGDEEGEEVGDEEGNGKDGSDAEGDADEQ